MDHNSSISKFKSITERLITRIDRYLADARLSPEEQLRKRWAWIWLVVTCVFVVITSFTELVVLKLWPIWWFGIVFLVGYAIGFPLFRRLQRFDLVINIVFSVFIIAAMFAMLQVGGLTTSMGFIFIGVNAAMGSVLVGNLRWTIGLFALYCATILLVGLFQSSLTTPEYVTPHANTLSFVGLAFWINACILFIVILFMNDKSRFEKAEAEKLRKLDEAKTLLYTNVSHEFRTPLTIIRGIAEQIEDRSGNQNKRDSQKIKTQSDILLRLVNQMLDISKLEAKGMQLNEIHGNIGKCIQYLTAQFESLAETHIIELSYQSGEAKIMTDYDPEKLMEVLSNLLSNAIKFTPPGGTITVSVSENKTEDQPYVQIRVADTGSGIPEEELQHIFDRFYQVKAHESQTPGTGLGLALTHELVQLMNGKISVESKPGKGSVFTVSLPINETARTADDDGISKIKSTEYPALNSLQSGRSNTEDLQNYQPDKPLLLIVEDNEEVMEYLFSVLEQSYQIDLALNGKEGLEKALAHIPDIILSDVMMPEMDGFEMIEQLKKDIRTDHIPIVVLTARGDFDSKIEGLETGADHYLVKPFHKQELLLKLNNLLEARKKMQAKLGFAQTLSTEKTEYRQEIKFMGKLNALLNQNIEDENFGIKEICEALNMSRPQLYRKFKALTNSSIGKYLRSYRLHKARQFIETEGKNVSEAAFVTGFKNPSHFSTLFHEEFGYPPSELIKDKT